MPSKEPVPKSMCPKSTHPNTSSQHTVVPANQNTCKKTCCSTPVEQTAKRSRSFPSKINAQFQPIKTHARTCILRKIPSRAMPQAIFHQPREEDSSSCRQGWKSRKHHEQTRSSSMQGRGNHQQEPQKIQAKEHTTSQERCMSSLKITYKTMTIPNQADTVAIFHQASG